MISCPLLTNADVTNTLSTAVWDCSAATYVWCEQANYASKVNRSMQKVMGTRMFGPHVENIADATTTMSMSGPILAGSDGSYALASMPDHCDIWYWFHNHTAKYKSNLSLSNISFKVGNTCNLSLTMQSRQNPEISPQFIIVNTDIPHGTDMGGGPSGDGAWRFLKYFDLNAYLNFSNIMTITDGAYVQDASLDIQFEYSPAKIFFANAFPSSLVTPQIPVGITFSMSLTYLFMHNAPTIMNGGIGTGSEHFVNYVHQMVERSSIATYVSTSYPSIPQTIIAPSPGAVDYSIPATYYFRDVQGINSLYYDTDMPYVDLLPFDVGYRKDPVGYGASLFGQVLGQALKGHAPYAMKNNIRWRNVSAEIKPSTSDISTVTIQTDGQIGIAPLTYEAAIGAHG